MLVMTSSPSIRQIRKPNTAVKVTWPSPVRHGDGAELAHDMDVELEAHEEEQGRDADLGQKIDGLCFRYEIEHIRARR